MPFIHFNYCANPVACKNNDKAMRMRWKRIRNEDVYYYFSHIPNSCHMSMSHKYTWW